MLYYIGGSDKTIFKEYEGEDYPFKNINNEAENPIFHYFFAYGYRGFYNVGLGDKTYQLNNVDEFNINNKITANINATKQYFLINVPSGKKNNADMMIMEGEDARLSGQTAFLINEIEEGEETISSYQVIGGASSALNESVSLDNMLVEKLTGIGISLQDVLAEKGKPLGSFEIEQENANRKAKYVGEQNSIEFKRMLEYFYITALHNSSIDDERPLDMREEVLDINGIEIEPENVTMGQAVKAIKRFKPFIYVDPMSGSVPSPVIEIQRLNEDAQAFANTPYGEEAIKRLAKERGINLPSQPQQQPIPEQNA